MQQPSDELIIQPLDIAPQPFDIPLLDITGLPIDFDPDSIELPEIEFQELDIQLSELDITLGELDAAILDIETDPDIIRMLKEAEQELQDL